MQSFIIIASIWLTKKKYDRNVWNCPLCVCACMCSNIIRLHFWLIFFFFIFFISIYLGSQRSTHNKFQALKLKINRKKNLSLSYIIVKFYIIYYVLVVANFKIRSPCYFFLAQVFFLFSSYPSVRLDWTVSVSGSPSSWSSFSL